MQPNFPEYQIYSRTSANTQKRRKTKRILFALLPLIIAAIVAIVIMVIHGQSIANAKDSVTVGGVSSATSPATASTTSEASTVTTTSTLQAQLKNAWASVATARAGDMDIAVYNNETGETTHYSNATGTLNTASVVKLAIAEAVFYQAQNEGVAITDAQTTELESMLENSDNTAATTLWNEAGGKTGMDTFFDKIGASSTIAADDGLWGLTQTTALDQVTIMNVLAYPGKILTATSAETIDGMLDNVESDQTWGVSAGLVGNADFKLKNGWLEDAQTNDSYNQTDSWTVNSVGHITADGVDYTISVLTEGQTTEAYGIETIEEISKATWTTLNQ